MRSVVLTSLSLFLGLFFIFIGSLKVSPYVNREMHREIRRNFIHYAKVLPLNDQFPWLKVTPRLYRLIIGWNEIVSGSLLVILPNWFVVKNLANISLFLSNVLFFYTHVKLGDKFERIAPSIVFGLMLLCRLIVYLQIQAREEQALKKQIREERKRKLAELNQSVGVPYASSSEVEDEVDDDEDDEDPLDQLDEEQFERLLKIRRKKLKNKLLKKQLNKPEVNETATNFQTEAVVQEDIKKNE